MDAELLLWTKIAAIGQVAGALATALAVAVSLWVVLSERQTRVKVAAGLRLIVAPGRPDLAEEVINITVVNAGLRPVSINSIGWRSGWVRHLGPKWARYEFAVQTSGLRMDSHDPPYILEPGQQKAMLVSLKPFHGNEASSQRTKSLFAKTLPFLGPVSANICCAAHIVGARSRYFSVERSLAEYLATGKTTGILEKYQAAADKKKQQAANASEGDVRGPAAPELAV